MTADLKSALAVEARALGFDAIGVTVPDAIPGARARLEAFLDYGAHGGMDWLAADPPRRADPRVLWREVRSVVMLGVNYGPDVDPRAVLAQRDRAAISVYAQGDDYHDLIKKRLKVLARWLLAQAGQDGLDGDVKVFVDTAAVMEKPLAGAAGLGWQGKHTNLVSREFGSWLFLGAVFTTLDLAPDAPEAKKGFLLNHLINELLPPKGDGRRWANSDPVTGQAAWFDLRVKVEKADPKPAESQPAFPPIKSPVGKGPKKVARKI